MTSSDHSAEETTEPQAQTRTPDAHAHHDGHDHASHGAASTSTGVGSDAADGPAKNSGAHSHSHGDAKKLSKSRLFTVLAITGSFMIVEAIGGFMTGIASRLLLTQDTC